MAGADKKNITKAKILQYIINNQDTSKVELSKKLNLSMPTVLSNEIGRASCRERV